MKKLIAIFDRLSIIIKISIIFTLIALIWEYWPIAVSVLLCILIVNKVQNNSVRFSIIIVLLVMSIFIQLYRTHKMPFGKVKNIPTPITSTTPEPTINQQISPTVLPTNFSVPSTITITPYSCRCDINYYNCNDFVTSTDAQRCFVYCGGLANDIHKLDTNLDYIACNDN